MTFLTIHPSLEVWITWLRMHIVSFGMKLFINKKRISDWKNYENRHESTLILISIPSLNMLGVFREIISFFKWISSPTIILFRIFCESIRYRLYLSSTLFFVKTVKFFSPTSKMNLLHIKNLSGSSILNVVFIYEKLVDFIFRLPFKKYFLSEMNPGTFLSGF